MLNLSKKIFSLILSGIIFASPAVILNNKVNAKEISSYSQGYNVANGNASAATLNSSDGQPTESVRDAVYNMSDMINAICSDYALDIDYKKLKINVLKAVMSSFDPYSVYMEPKQSENFKQAVDPQIAGIGVVMQLINKKIVVQQVINGTPAYKAGIQVKDIITQIDNHIIPDNIKLDEISTFIKGQVGSVVKVVVERQGKEKTFNVVRQMINLPSVTYQILKNNVGYVAINGISMNTYNEFRVAEQYLKSKNVKNVVLDLRDNGGGYVDVAEKICKDIIPAGKIASIQYTGQPAIPLLSTLKKAPFYFAVLMNKNTASAAELISGAIADRGVGILVGDKSFGKSVIQQIVGVDIDTNDNISFNPQSTEGNIGTIKLTVGKYYTPNGKFINGVGLKPACYAPYSNVYQDTNIKKFDYAKFKDIVLKAGDKTDFVKLLKEKLKYLGYVNSTDGLVDKTTLTALSKFQKDNNLKAAEIGKLSEEILKKIDSAIDKLSTYDLQLQKAMYTLTGKTDY